MFSWTPHSYTRGIQIALYPYDSQQKDAEQRHRELKSGLPLAAGSFKACQVTPLLLQEH